jgi:DNA-binding transcriptional MerR regulator
MAASIDMTTTTYTVGELARRTAVTVRTLHHYEHLGLLEPSERTEAGHRRYGARDVVRLRRITTLKALGVPLREIAALLRAAPGNLLGALRTHRELLARRRTQIDASIERIDALERRVREGDGSLTRDDVEILMETIAMENQENWARRYMTEVRGMTAAEAEAQMRNAPPEAAKGTRDWAALIAEVESAIAAGDDPRGERGRALAQRWRELIRGFTGGDAAKLAEVRQFYADLPAEFPKPYSDEVGRFIAEAAGPEGCS